MAGVLLAEHVPGLTVTTSGTHVIEGLPMSWRTADAIKSLGLDVPHHRSRQATDEELESADLIIAAATDHVAWMRRVFPSAAPRTATLKRLARDLAPAGQGTFAQRIAVLGLAEVVLSPSVEDVMDPAGGDAQDFVDTAAEIAEQIHLLAPRLVP